MSVKSGKDTKIGFYFQAALAHTVSASGKKKNDIAIVLGIAPSALSNYLNGIKVPSLAQMDGIALKLGIDLLDMLNHGRTLLTSQNTVQETTPDNESHTPEQIQAIEAFKICLKIGGDIPKMLAKTAIEHAAEKEADSKHPYANRWDKSA